MTSIDKPFSIIVAIAKNYAIGKNNQLLWHIPEDFRWFKMHTSGHTVIMGKNTFLSLPKHPLPNRRNIVISDNKSDSFDGVEMAYSIEEAIKIADSGKENFIIGGASIYQQFFPISEKLYITRVDKEFDADTYFPIINENEWKLVEKYPQKEPHPDNLHYEFCIYHRLDKIISR